MRYVRSKLRDDYQTGFSSDLRLRVTLIVFVLLALLITARLVILMIFQHGFYVALASGSHDVYNNLFPKRGNVYIQDSRTGEEYPLAINRDHFLVYANTYEITSDEMAEDVSEGLATVFHYDDDKKFSVYLQINKRDDPYEPLEKKVDEAVINQLQEKQLPGIGWKRQPFRYYPEGNLAAHVIGFVGKDEEGNDVGRYGIEGYWQKELAGSGGFFSGAKSALGGKITLAGWNFKPAEDGADILLSIDRTLQFQACEKLRQYTAEFKAQSAALIIMDPNTGAIRAMCSLPDFDPNTYNQVESGDVYNNTTIFTPYEPGSVFKPVGMAAALNEEILTPDSTFYDTGSRAGLCQKPIKNTNGKVYETQTMTGVLENSINTGMVFVAEQLGKKKFNEYVEKFGFGVKEGIQLDSEVSGDISTLQLKKGDDLDCYGATASFGQGITATPLQLITAFSAIAKGGTLMKPYIIQEIRYSDGKVERFKPEEIRQVINKQSAALLSGMLVNVVEGIHGKLAGVSGYYVAGKTGTAQIPGLGGYTDETIHSFIGYAPVDDPKFVMLIKFEKPQRTFSSATAAPVFGKIANFILQYYQVPPTR